MGMWIGMEGGTAGTAAGLVRWRRALAAIGSGIRPKLLCAGDSTTFGAGSTGPDGGELKDGAYPTILARMLSAAGLPAEAQSIYGDGSAVWESNHAHDRRVHMDGGWRPSADNDEGRCVGGQYFCAASSGALAFSPTTPVDTFRVLTIADPGGGMLGLEAGGAAAEHQTAAQGSGAIVPVSLKTRRGLQTLRLGWRSGGPVAVAAIEAFDSTLPGIDVANAGWSGATSADWAIATRPWSPARSLHCHGADLTLVSLGLNDIQVGIAPEAYAGNLEALVTDASRSGDVALVTFPPMAESAAPLARQRLYVEAIKSVSARTGSPVIDVWSRFGSHEATSPLGYYADAIHPRARGYKAMAEIIFAAIAG
jgi:lysophospholipase L1-like esterase